MRRIQGYTFVELTLVIVIVGILASVTGLLLKQGFESYRSAQPIIAVAGKANAAMDILLRELESARSITTANTTTLTYVNQAGVSILINLSGTNLQITEGAGTARTLCTEVTALNFTYFDLALASLSAPVGTPSAIRFVTLNMTVSVGTTTPYPLIGGTVLRKLLQ